MKKLNWLLSMLLAACWATAHAQVPPVETADQLSMLKSDDPHLVRNKRLVFDFWRLVYEGGHRSRSSRVSRYLSFRSSRSATSSW